MVVFDPYLHSDWTAQREKEHLDKATLARLSRGVEKVTIYISRNAHMKLIKFREIGSTDQNLFKKRSSRRQSEKVDSEGF